VLSIGQKVVCIDDRRGNAGRYDHETLPQRGSVYTIREIVPCKDLGYDEDGLRLVEIVNPGGWYVSPSGPVLRELAFRVSRFRPVRTTNIDVFRQMLEPQRVVEVAE
jgi:hypothetical protein